MQLQVRKTPRPCGLGQPISFFLGCECLSKLASQVYNPGPEMFGLLFPRHMATQSTECCSPSTCSIMASTLHGHPKTVLASGRQGQAWTSVLPLLLP